MKGNVSEKVLLTAIRNKCIDCCGGEKKEIENCNLSYCSLHPYRTGEVEIVKPVRKAKKIVGLDKALKDLNRSL